MLLLCRYGLATLAVATVLCLTSKTLCAAEGPQPDCGTKPPPPLAEEYLTSGRLAEGERALREHLKGHPRDDQARFGLGAIQFVHSVERVAQSLYRHGLRHEIRGVPFLRMPVGVNENPEPISYDDLRGIFHKLDDDLMRTEATLAKIRDPDVKLPLSFGQIRIDINGDGKAEPEEALWKIYARLNRAASVSEEVARQFVIAFDTGDVHWLRGYCHLLSAFCDFMLAHDMQELVESTAHVVFPKVESPHTHLAWPDDKLPWHFEIADAIAAIHLCRFDVIEPQRLESAHAHLLAVVEQSRLSWKAIQAETDDQREWVPNPQQSGVIPGVGVTQEMIDGWHVFLDEFEAILQGEKLLPHWRVKDGRGINLKRVFMDPQQFDLVLWAQGSAATPYLEEGERTQPETWDRLNRVFRGEFIGFAIWFN